MMKHRRGFVNLSYLTPLQKRRAERRLSRQKVAVRWARVCGVITGLSVTSLCLAHSAQGTHAMLYSQATNVNNTFSAARDFPSEDDKLSNQACTAEQDASHAVSDAGTQLSDIKNEKSVKDAGSKINAIQQDISEIQTDLQHAQSSESPLASYANLDLRDYTNATDKLNAAKTAVDNDRKAIAGAESSANQVDLARLEQQLQQDEAKVQQLQRIADSDARVKNWSSPAYQKAENAVTTTLADLKSAQNALDEAKKEVKDQQAKEKSKTSDKDTGKHGTKDGSDTGGTGTNSSSSGTTGSSSTEKSSLSSETTGSSSSPEKSPTSSETTGSSSSPEKSPTSSETTVSSGSPERSPTSSGTTVSSGGPEKSPSSGGTTVSSGSTEKGPSSGGSTGKSSSTSSAS